MGKDNWKKLIKRYANGRIPCNCGMAYYSKDSMGFYCKYGCSTNILFTMEDIAERVLKEVKN